MEVKKYLKGQLISLVAPAFIFAVGLVWPSFYWQVIGVILAIIIVLNSLYCLITRAKPNDDYQFTGGVGAVAFFLLAVLFTIAHWAHDDEPRYIVQNGVEQHVYEDCSTFPKGEKVKKVEVLEGYLYKYYDDCEKCKKRQKEEREQQKKEWKEMFENKKRNESNEMIDVLLNSIMELRKGSSASSVGEELGEYLYNEGYYDHPSTEEDEDYDY